MNFLGPQGRLDKGAFFWRRPSKKRAYGVIWLGLAELNGRKELTLSARCSDGHASREEKLTISASVPLKHHDLNLTGPLVDLWVVNAQKGTAVGPVRTARLVGNTIELDPARIGPGEVQVLRIQLGGKDDSVTHAIHPAEVELSTSIDAFRGGGLEEGGPYYGPLSAANLPTMVQALGIERLNKGAFISQRISKAETSGVVWWGVDGLRHDDPGAPFPFLRLKASCTDGHASTGWVEYKIKVK